MSFSITRYIYPLKEAITLSSTLDFTFDNPRTDSEKQLVRQFIDRTIQDDHSDKETSILPILTRAGFSVHRLISRLKEVDSGSYALEYYTKNSDKNFLDILSEIWIIVRMKEQKEFSDLQEDRTGLLGIILSKKETNYTKQFTELMSYCQLVSLLSNNRERYHGETFLLSKDPYEIFISSVNEYVYQAIEDYMGYNNIMEHQDRHINWLYWIDGYENVLKEAKRLDTLFSQEAVKDKRVSQKQSPKQKLFHIGELFSTSYEHSRNPELMILILVSIIEYLVTRNPDTTKFNVEDSITKQFKLKCAVLIHAEDTGYDLVKLSDELAKIYDQRSALAHGNYKDNFKMEEIVNSVILLYKFNKHILNAFIKDRQLIEYLKDN